MVLNYILVVCPRSLSSRADLRRYHKSRRVLDEISARSHLSRRDLRDITNLAEVLARSRLSRRDLRDMTNLAEFSSRFNSISTRSLTVISARSRLSRLDLGEISATIQISPRSRPDFVNLGEISPISARSRLHFCTGNILRAYLTTKLFSAVYF